VSVAQFDRPRTELEPLRSAGCQIFYRQRPSYAARLARKIIPLPNYQSSHLRSVGTNVNLVVISQGSLFDGLPWIETVRAARLRYVIIVQGVSEIWWPSDNMAERLAAGFDSAARSYFVSEATLDLSRRQFGTELRSGKVIRNPFNVRYDACPSWPTDVPEELCLACVGRLEVSTKGQDVLLETLNLPHWRQRKVRVSIIGTGPQERCLQRRAQELNLNVNFLGHQSDIDKVWSSHHALVLPSRQEGMPLVVVEAMLAGRPCIATDVGGNRELIRDGVNGFLAKAATVELLDEAMNRAWENRGRLPEMGERAAHDVRQWVSPDPTRDFVRELTSLIDGTNQKEGDSVPQSVELHR
jgi:glycosyltransferase involved in cell wall biosynthesis